MDRPVTSKSRGICRYYTTPRGCFAGDDCKFLHGADEMLTPYDKAKVCRYYARGHCTRGDQCWFRHDIPKVAPDDERIQYKAESCCICLEKPITYGLLTDCSHIFCLECIRQWRTPTGKSLDVVYSGTIKCCPLCRTSSRFVIPSAHFFPDGSSRKKETIDAYKASMARVPCKYFEETSRIGKPCCPFGTDCFYQHINSDGTPHAFRHGAKHFMDVYRRRHFRGANIPSARFDPDDPIEFLQHIFENPITNLHATLDVIRASLPVLMERLASSNENGSYESNEDEITGDVVHSFEALEDNFTLNDEAEISPSVLAEGDIIRSMPLQAQTPEVSTPSQSSLILSNHSPSQPQPTRLSSRFSTVTSAHSRQTFVIEISDDEEEEEEEGFPPHGFEACENKTTELSDSSVSAGTPIPQSSPEQPPTSPLSVGHIYTDMSRSRAQCERDIDPPFLTDGRGRVVWSSTRSLSASARATTAEGRAPRHSRTGSTSRVACPPHSPTLVVPNTRGYAWSGQDVQSLDGKVGVEENDDMD